MRRTKIHGGISEEALRVQIGQVLCKSSQVANSHKAQINAPCKEPSTAKERTPHAARLKPPIKISPGAPSVYGTEWANPHGLTLVCDLGVPTRECIPLLYLLYYHKADVTSQTRALLRQNDVIHYARRVSRAQVPRRGDAPVK